MVLLAWGSWSPWFVLVLAVLVTWRIAHLVAVEDGPLGLMARIRASLGPSGAGGLGSCFGCVSLWIGLILAVLTFPTLPQIVLAWLAYSGGAFLLERFIPQTVVIERVPEGAGDR